MFLGVYESAKPDGNLKKAKEYFEKGIALGHDTFLMAYVQYALSYSVKAQDRESFRSILNTVLEKSQEDVPSPVLINTIARREPGSCSTMNRNTFLTDVLRSPGKRI